MSRIDDDIEARRRAELQKADKKANELRRELQAKSDAGANVRFAAALETRGKAPPPPPKAKEAPKEAPRKEGRPAPPKGNAPEPRAAKAPPRRESVRQEDEALGRTAGQASAEALPEEGRVVQAKRRDAEGDRRDSDHREEKAAEQRGSSRPDPHGKVGRAKAGKDDQKGSGGGGKDEGPAAFKVPPQIFMQPPPVRQPVGTQAPAGRTLAQGLIDKIVERVRVGVNRAGLPEFQIDMKADILGGVTIRLTCKRGRVRASFKGEKSVLAQIAEEEQALRQSLEKRGLYLDALDLEEG